MNTRNVTLLGVAGSLVCIGMLLACQSAPSNNTTSVTTNPTATPASTPSPARMSAEKQQRMRERAALLEKKMADNPCWVHIWEDENYEDDNDVIYGPGKWNNMRHLPGANKEDWGDEIDSLKVGPGATVIVWEDEDFKDNSQTYGPGTEKTNLRGNPDMGDQIDSMEIRCQ